MPRTTAATRCLLAVLLGGASAFALAPAAAQAAPGFDVQITELPGEFVAGSDPSTVTVVASTDVGRRCQKVRWSLVLRVNGISLDQVRVDRVEDSGSVPLTIQSGGDTARLTDRDLDPGELCRGRAVTASYQVAFDDDVTDGELTLQAEAYNRRAQLLEQADVTRPVVREAGTSPSPSEPTDDDESADADDDESADADDDEAEPAPDEPRPTASPPGGVASVPTSGDRSQTSMLGIGLIVGAVLIFLGVGILLRMRLRKRDMRAGEVPLLS